LMVASKIRHQGINRFGKGRMEGRNLKWLGGSL